MTGPQRLEITWKDGFDGTDTVDLGGVIDRFEPFAPLRDETVFGQVQVVDWGSGIAWPNGLDTSATSLHALAEQQRPFTGRDFIAWQDRLRLSNQEAADLLDLGLSTVKTYRDPDRQLPRTIAVVCRTTLENDATFYALYHPRKPGRPALRHG